MAKFCTNCGTQVNDDTKFCINCGAKLQETELTAQKKDEHKEVVKHPIVTEKDDRKNEKVKEVKKNKITSPEKIGWAIIIVVVLLTVGVFIAGLVLGQINGDSDDKDDDVIEFNLPEIEPVTIKDN